MKKLFKFHWECGRMGDLHGIFVAEQEEVDALIDTKICFGEVLGKHSEISGTLESDDFEVLTDDQDFIDKAQEYGMDSIGINPFHYTEEDR